MRQHDSFFGKRGSQPEQSGAYGKRLGDVCWFLFSGGRGSRLHFTSWAFLGLLNREAGRDALPFFFLDRDTKR